jgi:Leucine-rich repeat (LRR) protein
MGKMRMLATIDLSGTDVSDDEVGVLVTLPKIETLILDSTDVTAKSLRDIEKCKSLRVLSLNDCKLAAGATAMLQHTNPGLVRITGKGHTVIAPRENGQNQEIHRSTVGGSILHKDVTDGTR